MFVVIFFFFSSIQIVIKKTVFEKEYSKSYFDLLKYIKNLY